MVLRTGSFLLVMFWFLPLCAEITARLEYFDMYGSAIKQAQVGVPIKVVLTLEGDLRPAYTDHPDTLPGFDKAKVLDRLESMSHMLIQNMRSEQMRFTYLIQFDTKGAYAVGPYETTLSDGRTIKSNPLYIVVSDEPIYTQKKQKQAAELNLTLDHKKVYYGQKVTATLQFLYAQDVEQVQCQPPMFDDFVVKDRSVHSRTGTLEKDGTKYKFHEWNFELYPTKVGTVSIAAGIAQFAFARTSRGFFDHAIFDIFGNQTHQLRSLPTSLEVMPLPSSAEYARVSAVGTFENLSMNIAQDHADVGDGVILSLELVGDGNMGMIDIHDLVMPKEFKWYSSHTAIESLGNGKERKRFEFIVQGLQPGSYTIPAQTLVYFDVRTGTYKKLTSNTLVCTVTGQAKVDSQDEQEEDIKQPSRPDVVQQETQDSFEGYLARAGTHSQTPFHIPVAWFEWLLSLLLTVLGVSLFFASAWFLKMDSWSWVPKVKQWYTVRRLLAAAYKSKNSAQLLRVVDYVCITYARVCGQEAVLHFIKNSKLPADQKERMSSIYMTLLAHVYHHEKSIDFDTLYSQVSEFISEFIIAVQERA